MKALESLCENSKDDAQVLAALRFGCLYIINHTLADSLP